MTTADAARRRRRAAADRFRPERIELLLVVEGPPSALDRYFYFEDVTVHDSLFRHVVEVALGERPTRDKTAYLHALQDNGWFVIDLSPDPFNGRDALGPLVPALVRRVHALRPERVLLVGVRTYDVAFSALRDAGLPVVDARLPYPGSGQQRRFVDELRELLPDLSDPRPPMTG